MRSTPRCSKAVFCVFVFDSIYDSATMYNHCPQYLSTEPVFFIFGGGVRKSGRNLVILWNWVCVLMALGRETMNRGVRPHRVFN